MKVLPFVLLIMFAFVSCESPDDSESAYKNPTSIKGQVKNPEGVGLGGAKLTLTTASSFEPVYADDNGYFTISGFPSGKHTARVEKPGYLESTVEIPSAINGTSTLYVTLNRATYNVPSVKPLSTGPVRINAGKLEVDFAGTGTYSTFYIKGVAYSPAPIDNKPTTSKVHDRSIVYLKILNANTIRTYSGADTYLLQKCAANGIRVIVSYWVDYTADLTNVTVRKSIVDGFSQMVFRLKDYPGVLMWNIGNEQNYQNGNSASWYSLTQEMAIEAYKVEGAKYHPVCVNNGGITNIGSAAMSADDKTLTYVDAWATNIYQFDLTPSFNTYKTKSAKPLIITEFGIDALDHRTKTQYETQQAMHDSTNWAQIKASSFVLGGTVFEFTDEWWKAGDAGTQDYGGYPTGAHPDGYSNEEWWGLVAVTRDVDGDGLDEWRARKAFDMFSRNWK